MDTYRIAVIRDVDRIARHPHCDTSQRLPVSVPTSRPGTSWHCLSSPPQQHPQRDPGTASHLLVGGTKGPEPQPLTQTGDSSWGIVVWEHSWVLPVGQPDMAGLV